MSEEFGVDLEKVFESIDASDVLVVRFHIVQKRLFVDFRTKPGVGPFAAVVQRAESVEDRFRSIKKMRPEFGFPDKVSALPWPRTISVLVASGVWSRVAERMTSLGGAPAAELCAQVLAELQQEERREIVGAIRGADHYQTMWERQRA